MRTGRAITLVAVAAFGSAFVAAPAGGGEGQAAPLTVQKVVVGEAPPGTQFVVEFDCEDGNNTLDAVVFDEFGDPVGPDTTSFTDPDECSVVETQTGGAATVSYECTGSFPDSPEPPTDTGDAWPEPEGAPADSPCDTSGPQAEPITVFIVTEGQEATVTVTNTFPPPPEPEPLVVEPAFTG
jgi:hypothetical protein